ncbi:MAG: phosphodiester glycosidase family protein [Desulfovibrionaceae bacterium]|nr:phosphodiester glycosidase family protein [Desulfovibrionaceae bacterium]
MRWLCCISVLSLFFSSYVSANTIQWIPIHLGAEMATIPVEASDKPLIIVRFIPKYFTFSLLSSKLEQNTAMPITEWSEKYNFIAAINASMFAEDTATSVSFLKSNKKVNNAEFSKVFGAVFLSNPTQRSLPSVTIVEQSDMEEEEVKKLVKQYSDVVQNYRMINSKGEVVWKSYSTTPSTMSAVGIDAQKRILFIHSQALLTQNMLATMLTKLPLDIRTTMYTEGGKEAILALSTNKVKQIWLGQSRNPFTPNMNNVPVPNLIIVSPKKRR